MTTDPQPSILCLTCKYGRRDVVFQSSNNFKNLSVLGVICETIPGGEPSKARLIPARLKCTSYVEWRE